MRKCTILLREFNSPMAIPKPFPVSLIDDCYWKPVRYKSTQIGFLLFFLSLFFLVSSTYAQVTDPHIDCTNGCTSNDVQIKAAYLVEPNSPNNPLSSSFQCQGNTNVKLALDLTTKTPRYGVYVYAKIVSHASPTTVYATVSECFSTALASGGTTKVVFSSTISWPCGTPIDLVDVFIGWGTGNTDFCQGSSSPRCPATPSKCFALPPGEYISIQIPSASNASMTQCETTVGAGTSSFNLTSLNGTVSNNALNVTVNWWENYSAGSFSNYIPNPGTYVSGSKTVYAKVKNNADSTAYGVSTVTLTVVPRPATLVLTGSSICASNPNTGTITSTSSQTGVKYLLKNGSNVPVGDTVPGTGSGLSWTGLAAGNGYYVVSEGAAPTKCTGSSNTVNVVSVANPVALVLTGSSICAGSPNTGTITSSTSQTGVKYILKNGSDVAVGDSVSGTGSGLLWTGLAAGNGYYVVSKGASPTNCPGSSNTVNVISVANPVALVLTGSSICAGSPNTGMITSSTSQTGVKYLLKNGSGVAVGDSVSGTGSGLNWTGLAAGSGYYVVSVGASPTYCPGSSNTVNVVSVANPVALVLTGSSICAGSPNTGTITSSTSQTGVKYQLKNGADVAVGDSVSGTGSGLLWTGLPAGNGYYVVSKGAAPTNCLGGSNTVNIVSVSNPVKLDLTGSSICTSYPNTGSITSSASQAGVKYILKNSADVPVGDTILGTGSGLSWNNLAAGNGYYVVSKGTAPTNCAGNSDTVDVLSVANPSAPAVTYNPPGCNDSTFSITITGVVNGATYTVKDKNGNTIAGILPGTTYTAPNNSDIIFSKIPPGSGYQVTVQMGDCSSTASSCPVSSAKSIVTTQKPQEVAMQAVKGLEVRAYPNPFNEKVKFVVSTPVSGNGSLEVFNILGQKVMTVHQGYMIAGTQTFEMSLPSFQKSALIYVLTVGEERLTGKLLKF